MLVYGLMLTCRDIDIRQLYTRAHPENDLDDPADDKIPWGETTMLPLLLCILRSDVAPAGVLSG